MRPTILIIAAVWAQEEVLDLRSPQEVDTYRSKGLIPFRDLVDASPGPQFSCDRLVSRDPIKLPRQSAWREKVKRSGPAQNHTRPSDVGIGYMFRSLTSTYKSDVPLLTAARQSWMADAGASLEILLLVDCDRDTDVASQLRPPADLEASRPDLPRLHFECYYPSYNKIDSSNEVTAILNNFDKFSALLKGLLRILPHKKWYIKLDTDTVIEPHNLYRFLSFFQVRVLRGETNLYFGDAGELPQRSPNPEDWAMYRIHSRSKDQLFKREGWQDLVKEYYTDRKTSQQSTITYVHGGLEGFSRDALQSIVSKDCIRRVGELPCDRSIKKHCINKPEDATVGLCAHLHKIALVDCQPCMQNIAGAPVVDGRTPGVVQWTRQELGKVFTADARFCPRPVSVHPVKDAHDQRTVYRALHAYTHKVHAAESTAVAPPE